MPRPLLGDLARASGHHVLMALTAALRVVGRPEPVGDLFNLLEDESVVVERGERRDVAFFDGVKGRPLNVETARQVTATTGWTLLVMRAVQASTSWS